jgi:hypothetical protein
MIFKIEKLERKEARFTKLRQRRVETDGKG